MKQVGVQSIMVQPVVSRGRIVALLNLMYTTESGRRYGRDDPGLAAEMALHASYVIENARLLKDLRASEARFRIRGELEGRWDPARVQQALSNLVGNALEYGDLRSPVRLSVIGSDEAVVVKVRNGGPPIPTELRPALFEPFSRGPTSPHGLGLGLFIVKEIAAAHGGTIDVESSAEIGTVFTLVLPRAA